MAKVLRTVYTNFASGELNPLLNARTDASAYFNGAKTLRNWYLLDEGGLMRRPGTTYKSTLPGASRIIPFIFSNDEMAVFALSNNRLDVFNSSGASVQANITSNCNWTTAQLFELNYAQFGDTVFIVHRDNPIVKIVRTSASNFAVSLFTFEENETVTVGGVNKTTQPFFKYAASTISVTLSAHATGTGRTLTASSGYFTADYVGTYLLVNNKQVKVTGFTSSTEITVTVIEDTVSNGPHFVWAEQLISSIKGFPQAVTFHDNRLYFGGIKDKPASVIGSVVGEYFNFEVGSGNADDAIDVTITADRINEIRHLVSSRNLQVFTDGGEFFVPSSSDTSAVTPSNIVFMRQTPYGCNRARPVIFDGATLYAQKNGKAIREYLFSDVESAYASTSISILASQVINNPVDMAMITGTATRPEQFAFFTNTDGTLALFHSIRSEKIAGWTAWSTRSGDNFTSITAVNENLFCVVSRVIGGSTIYTLEKFADDDTLTLDCSDVTTLNQQGSPKVNGSSQSGLSLNVDGYTTAPNPNDIITIAGNSTEYTIQTVNATATGFTLVLNQTLAATPSDNAVITIVQGRLHNTPTHLTSTSVYAVDGTMALGTFTTTGSNTITLNEAHPAGVTIGFNFSPELETMPIDKEVQNGPLTGNFKRISRAVIDVADTLNIALQASDRTAKNLIIRQVDFNVATSVAKVTGKKEFYFLGYDRSPTVKITQTEPLPLKLLGMALEVIY
ncbi:MAG: hypothetical protein Tp1102MES731781_46 [Prokaryotic dsDNA virus sp.]|nr:MAG: hypothetical protein Tp1102MES731781_46 [Prokaryotic dsDNA virus sp.]|tara:strand:- start:4252 stop:6447 length:2196 start_codon:yes stop_codon:yes gene_type:complete